MSYTLTYFDIPAVAEPIRLLLLLGKFEYEDRRVQFKEWPEMKSTTKWGQLPVLEIPEGQSLSQSRAILRYLGRQTIVAGYTEPLYPSDPLKAFYVDELMDTLDDARLKLIPTFSIKDQSEKEAARAALFGEEGDITKLMKKARTQIETSCPGYQCGCEARALLDLFCLHHSGGRIRWERILCI